jgi:ribose 5-phosphate isomerase B
VVLGGSGQGEAMTANRHKGVRAAVLHSYNSDIVRLSREHNDANVLSFGARFLNERKTKKALKLWLETPFSAEERHERRIKKIDS